jgi:elongation factor G
MLLEPVMKLEVHVPEDYLGEVMNDLHGRRARVTGIESRNEYQVVQALAPLAEMFGYSTDLRSATQGRATFTLQFASYERVPDHLAKGIVNKIRGI